MYMTHIIILLSNSVPDIFNRDLNHWHPDYLGLGNWRKATKIWNMPQNKDSKVRLFPTPRLPIVPPSQRPWYLWTASHNSFWKQKVGMANVFMTGVILLESPKMTLAMTSCHCLKINHPPTPIWHIVPAYVKDSRNGLDSCLEFIQEIAKKKKGKKKKEMAKFHRLMDEDSWIGKFPWRRDRLPTPVFLGFPGGSDGKESAYNVGDLGSIPRLGRSPGGGHSKPFQNSCLENPHGERILTCYSSWGCKKSDMTECLNWTDRWGMKRNREKKHFLPEVREV